MVIRDIGDEFQNARRAADLCEGKQMSTIIERFSILDHMLEIRKSVTSDRRGAKASFEVWHPSDDSANTCFVARFNTLADARECVFEKFKEMINGQMNHWATMALANEKILKRLGSDVFNLAQFKDPDASDL